MRVRHLLMSGAVATALVAGVGGSTVTSFAATGTGHTSSAAHKHHKASPSGVKHNTPKGCHWVNKHHHSCQKVTG
jgi:hypothetical protein